MTDHVKHILDKGDETTIVFNNINPGSLTFDTDVALAISKALNSHFARKVRFERELELHPQPRKLLTHAGKQDETEGGPGPEVA
jgi:hypothetical protein